jgi:ribosomal-protein-alanine N-acetyltransferase
MSESIIETQRLFLRELDAERDAEFILELVNEPAWIKNIGNRKIHSIEDARGYILNGPAPSYRQHGFGLYLVGLKETDQSIGICGLIKRDSLEDVDIGFAFLERFWSKGYAVESARAVMDSAAERHKLTRVVAITVPTNRDSIKLLEKIGFKFEKMIKTAQDEEEIMLFGIGLPEN